MDLHRVDPQVRSAIEESAHNFLRGFTELGIDTVPKLVSFENAEYVSRLLAIEAAIPVYERDAYDREIVLRFHQQLCTSGLLGENCAIAMLQQRLDKLRSTILAAEDEIQEIRCSLTILEIQKESGTWN